MNVEISSLNVVASPSGSRFRLKMMLENDLSPIGQWLGLCVEGLPIETTSTENAPP